MPWITKEGRTVEEAQDAAIAAAGLSADELDIEVVNEGAKGLFGLGGEPAVVRVRPRDEATDFRHAFRSDITPAHETTSRRETVQREPQPPVDERADASLDERSTQVPGLEAGSIEGDEFDGQPHENEDDDEASEENGEPRRPLSEQQEEAARVGSEIVLGILERMGLDGDVNSRVAGGTVYIEVFGDEMGILIGRGGTTLEALQELVRAGVQRRLKTRQAIVVDVEAYWERRRRPSDDRRGPRRGGGGGGHGGGGRRGGRGGGRGGPRRDPNEDPDRDPNRR